MEPSKYLYRLSLIKKGNEISIFLDFESRFYDIAIQSYQSKNQ